MIDKKEACLFINDVARLKGTKSELKPEDIELYTNRYITKKFKDRETDIIYKMKEKDVFFLIEHQSTVDYNMPRRIVEYKIEIINQYIQNSKSSNKKYKTPLIKAIVLYTGRGKWKVKESIEETQEKLEDVTEESFSKYKALDVNKYEEKEMLEKEGALYKIILLDRANNKEKTEQVYKKVLKSKLTKEEKAKIEEYAINILAETLGEKKIEEISKEYLKKGGKTMLAETLKREMRRDRREARKEGQKIGEEIGRKQVLEEKNQIIKEMLKSNIDIELIKKCTRLTDKELEKIKNEV